MVAQAVTGTPGHINSLAMAAVNILDEYPPDIAGAGRRHRHQRPVQDRRSAARRHRPRPACGDDGAGHRVLRLDDPPHRRRRLRHRRRRARRVRGRPVDPDLQAHEGAPTGLERNDDVWKFILSNVRQPDHMAGDLHAQMASGEIGAQRLAAPVRQPRPRRHRGPRRRDHPPLRGRHPRQHPRAAGRDATRRPPCSTSPTARSSTSCCAITVDPDAGEILVDYTGSSAASPWGINVVQATTPTPTRRSRCGRSSTPTSPTTTAAWPRSR